MPLFKLYHIGVLLIRLVPLEGIKLLFVVSSEDALLHDQKKSNNNFCLFDSKYSVLFPQMWYHIGHRSRVVSYVRNYYFNHGNLSLINHRNLYLLREVC